jgi:hypothetical protein
MTGKSVGWKPISDSGFKPGNNYKMADNMGAVDLPASTQIKIFKRRIQW